ncbi:unnamed protein product [Closterium sp. NIES-64]|nr:unnamed protein product [Closterium sp. NIES-64]
MNRHQLPPGLQRRVLRQEQQNFTATRGIDEEGLIRSMPKSLRRDIKRHLCLDLVKQVPLFQVVDSAALDAVCERLKPLILIHGTEIVRQGEPVCMMLFLIRGTIRSTHTMSHGTASLHESLPLTALSLPPLPSFSIPSAPSLTLFTPNLPLFPFPSSLPRRTSLALPSPPPPLPPQLVSHPGWKLLWGRAALVGLGPLPKHQPASLRYCLALPTPLPILPPLTPQLVSHPGWQILRGRAALVVAGPLVSHPGWKLLWGRAALVAAGPLPGHQPDSKACPAIHLSHLPLELLPHPGWVFLWRGAALVGSRPLFHPDTHQLAAAAAVTPTSVCSPRLPSPIPCSSCLIRDGYFYGEELLSWGLGQSPDTNQLPSATATLTTVTAVEGFVLEAEDLLFVTTHFKFNWKSQRIQRWVRYYSPHWRTWAALTIQIAWRRHVARQHATSLQRSLDAHADVDVCGGQLTTDTPSGAPPASAATAPAPVPVPATATATTIDTPTTAPISSTAPLDPALTTTATEQGRGIPGDNGGGGTRLGRPRMDVDEIEALQRRDRMRLYNAIFSSPKPRGSMDKNP